MSILRTLAERLSRNRVFKRHLPAEFCRVPILVSPDASLRFWKQRLQSDLFDFAREFVQPGSVVWDIGTNVGLFATAASQRAGADGQVTAVEADLWLAQLLRRTASTSAPIQVLPVAVSGSSAVASFQIARRGRASNFLAGTAGLNQAGGVRYTVHVITVTLDWLLAQGPPPNVIKIDVEGAELDVLRGGLRVLAETRPVILCEVAHPNADRITELLVSNGYRLYNWESHPRQAVDRATYNTLAIPAGGESAPAGH